MRGKFSEEVFLLSLAVVMFTVGLVYMNNLLDYDNDIRDGKKSICIWSGSKVKAVQGLLYLYFAGYLFCLILTAKYSNFLYYIPAITMLYAYEVYKSAKNYGYSTAFIPVVKWWYLPLDNWEKVKKSGKAGFYLRLFLARNLMIWFSLLMCIAVLY